jgi:hypothetical protein
VVQNLSAHNTTEQSNSSNPAGKLHNSHLNSQP